MSTKNVLIRVLTITALGSFGLSSAAHAEEPPGPAPAAPALAPLVRLGFVENDAPAMGADGRSFVNPIVGATYARRIAALRWAAFLGATIPIGMGGGNTPDAGASTANASGIRARSAMDN